MIMNVYIYATMLNYIYQDILLIHKLINKEKEPFIEYAYQIIRKQNQRGNIYETVYSIVDGHVHINRFYL